MQCVKVQQRLTTARTAAAPWRSKLQSIQQERDMVATKADLLRKSVLASSKRHEEVTAELEISENELETNKARLKALKSSREAHKVQSREKSAALESAKKVVATSEAAVSEARSVLQGLASAMASAKTQGQLAKALADAHSNGDIRVSPRCCQKFPIHIRTLCNPAPCLEFVGSTATTALAFCMIFHTAQGLAEDI